MTVLNSVLPFVGMLVALIVIHEFGHYLTAKFFGIKVLEAGIGYPPRAWGFTWRGTTYSINYLPLGGFVRLLGEEDPADPQSLAAQAAWKRLIVLISGSWMNFVLPIMLFAIAFTIPRDIPKGPAVIDLVQEDTPAQQAGLQVGDRIISINGERIRNTLDATREIRLNMGETLTLEIQRPLLGGSGYETVETRVKARWDPPEGQGPTGILIRNQVASSLVCSGSNRPSECFDKESYPPWEAVPKGWESTWEALILARNQVISMIKGGSGPDVAGPVGIAEATGEVVEEAGWQHLLDFAALLSINLAIINMLPLPMLDGGRVAFVVLEVIRRGKRIAPEKEAIVHLVGLAVIITVAAVITYFDILRIIGGGSLFE